MPFLSLPPLFVALPRVRAVFTVTGLMAVCLSVFAGDHEHDHGKGTLSHQEGEEHSQHQHHDQHQHQQHSHQHGRAELMLAQEGNRVDILLESPAVNIVGFEHPASTTEEVATLASSRTALQSPERLFDFQGKRCTATEVSLDLSAVEPVSHHEQHEHDDLSEHGEISAHYRFHCVSGNELHSISMNLALHFPAIDVLQIQWVTDRGQGAIELSGQQLADRPRIALQPAGAQ